MQLSLFIPGGDCVLREQPVHSSAGFPGRSSGKNLFKIPLDLLFFTGHPPKTRLWCRAERGLYVAVTIWRREQGQAFSGNTQSPEMKTSSASHLWPYSPAEWCVCVLSGVNPCVRLQTSHITDRVVRHSLWSRRSCRC